jgi:hypothetical protein
MRAVEMQQSGGNDEGFTSGVHPVAAFVKVQTSTQGRIMSWRIN